MPRPRVKICGITNRQDARTAAIAGADAIGLNFYAESSRVIRNEQVAEILQDLPVFTTVVGLVVNPTEAEVQRILSTGFIECLQFHGDETEEFCESFGVPYLKAIRVQSLEQAREELDGYKNCHCFLLDTFVTGEPGGTGKKFDWSIASSLVAESDRQVVLAGGLDADNVSTALEEVLPYGVDVCSGVEASPGTKDPVKINEFMAAVSQCSQ